MAQTKITRSKTIEEKIFDEFKNNAEEANKALLELLGTQKEVFEQGKKMSQAITFDKDLVKGIQAVEEEQSKLIKNQETFAKAEKLQLKLEKQLNDASDENVKGKIRLQKVNREQKQLLEAQLILEKKEVKSLKDLKDANKALRVERDRLDIKTQSARIKELNDQIDSNNEKIKENVDSLSQQKINVGNYKDSVKEALEETGAFDTVLDRLDGTAGKIIGSIDKVINGLRNQEKATKGVDKATEGADSRIKKLGRSLKATGIAVIIALLTTMVAAFVQSRKGARELQIITEQVSNSLLLLGTRLIEVAKSIGTVYLTAFNFAIQAAKELKLGFLDLINAIEIPPKTVFGKEIFAGFSLGTEESKKKAEELRAELEKEPEVKFGDVFTSIGNIITTTIDVFKDFDDVFISTNTRLREQLELQDRLIDQKVLLGSLISEQATIEAIQQQIADDSTKSFAEQTAAINKVIDAQEERLRLQNEIGKIEQEIALNAIKTELERAGVLDQVTEKELKSLSFLADKKLADAVSITSIEALQQATSELGNIETERFVSNAEAETKRRVIARDLFEQELDFAIDIFDNQKTINEQLIGDEQKTLKERFKILAETKRLNDSSFQSQIDLAEEFAGKKLGLDALIQESDERIIRTRLRALGLDEITQQRLLEIIRDRKTANLDLLMTEKALNKELFDSEVDLQEFRRDLDVTLAEEETERRANDFKEAEFFSSKKLKLALDALEEEKEARLAVVELEEDVALQLAKNESEKTRIIEENAEKRRQIERDTVEQRVEIEKLGNQRILESAQAGIAFLENIQRKNAERRLKAIDDEISANQKQQDALRTAAQEGTKGAAEDLAIAERQEAEAQERRKQELKKQQRDEAKLVFLKILASKAEQGDKNPFLSAVIEFGKTEAFLNTLDSFDKGVDRLGKADNAVDNKGGRPIVAHEDEMIVTSNQNAEMGFPTRDRVLENFHLAERLRAGDFEKAHKELTVVNQYQSNDKMVESFKSLENAVRANKPPKVQSYWNESAKMMTAIIEQGNKKDTYKTKIGGGGILGTD